MIERAPAPARPTPASQRPQGGFFHAPAGRVRFGWVHRPVDRHSAPPSGGAAQSGRAGPCDPCGIGLVIVPPFGYEAICAHRSLAALAEQAASAGLIAVRFDLDGTGDSAGDDLDPGRLEAWLASVADACDLARGAGADRIVLAGVRLGATLATLAAARRTDVAGVVAIAPVPSGKALVREGRALQMALGLAAPPDGATRPPDEAHEVVGFALTGETRTALSQIDLAKAERAPAPSMLVIDRDDLPANDTWVAKLRALGVDVEHETLPGYVEMVLDPHRVVVPRAILDATVAYAAERPPLAERVPAGRELALTPRAELVEDRAAISEDVIGLDDSLVGIATRPRGEPRRVVILLDAGSVYRVGPNRLYVALARRLAAHGSLVLRVDLSGIGDSPPRPGAPENEVYSRNAIDDVGVAVAWARRQGPREVAVVGLCSGAYHALKAAVAGQAIDTVVSINPLTFFWQPGMPLDFATFRVTGEAARYQKSALSAASWKKLLRGEVDVARIARIFAKRAQSVAEGRAKDLARRLRVPLRDDLGTELLALGRRGVAMRFIFAGDDPGRAMLLEQGGSAVSWLREGGTLAIDVIDGPDHTFTPRWSHPLLLAAIERAVARS